jgi:hypothetical protein
LLEALRQGVGERSFLEVGAVGAAGLEAEELELGGGEEGGDVFVAGGRAAAVEVVVGEEGHVGADLSIDGGWCCLRGMRVEGGKRILRLTIDGWGEDNCAAEQERNVTVT